MANVFIKELFKHLDQTVTIKGWVYNFRSSGKIAFLQIRDGSGFCQAIVTQPLPKITIETSVILTGKVSKHPKKEEYELQVEDLKVVQLAQDYPIGKKEHGPDFLLENRHLWLRSPKQWAIQKIRHTIIYATYEWMDKNSFVRIDAPILTPAACEGTTTLFEVPYFDLGKAYLSQSGQLYIEAAIFAHGRCYDFGPVFRAEKSKTRRHLTEFWMMDAEMAFVEHDENLKIQEELISFIVQRVLEKNQTELKILERDPKPLENIKAPFYRLTHAEVVKKLKAMGADAKEDDDLGGDEETLLSKSFDKPVFVEKYPAKVKAFYMKRDPQNSNLALCADMIAPEGFGEIIGGSQREEDIEVLLARLKEHNLPREAFEWYLDLRKYGSVPHSGFGFGLERLVSWICNLEHVRESIPFPRMIYRLTP
ncbi:MAG: asparagine--tRNA ligase [Deltaproteobacteria bacterium RIFCSPLOWO2_01_44_7]|nr:MAG: asparagine--tRNA ligase [Deltaproteobacteria bacterium RIFCSPHIGHO2_01_FULL_43_49]OGQ14812.1 MAG: asparagine--tRNA ligase [Deltaproteobacteria bacterium RIFCSPHIGHO2_02_FULL_44_53]OGQ28198.1 MAG: asparagine--tRNA ligase [Deltaproteobacteria bacterium RIFCSPHIGHO2_12_FULL_44_21]OGQ31410.1 MAG: asparagine--tRNA ligase [Deltaproteobacteria bacterium RIFCSPLOWO2_01_FULL_45_74]OGQ38410.1 MAG: asparagine--tRNA ligase [Deltaproteobacteria bacterium RIFCSPLOWO2_01_44_7]OGQ43402.1 MAG: asparagi